jgi:hypothetical protein
MVPYSAMFRRMLFNSCVVSTQGFQMAAALHADAVGRGTVPQLPPHAAPPPRYHLAAAAVAAESEWGAAQPAASPAIAAAAQQVLSHMCPTLVSQQEREPLVSGNWTCTSCLARD